MNKVQSQLKNNISVNDENYLKIDLMIIKWI